MSIFRISQNSSLLPKNQYMYTRISQDASFTKKYDWQKTFQEFISLSNLPVFSMTKCWLNNEEINEVALQMKKIIQTRTHSRSCLKLWADIQPGLRVCVDKGCRATMPTTSRKGIYHFTRTRSTTEMSLK